jgi:hypothetical protein
MDFTSAQCRGRAQEKLAQAERDPQHSKRLTDAAQAWLLLASNLRREEAVVKQRETRRR